MAVLASLFLASCAATNESDIPNSSFAAGASAGAMAETSDAFATAATTNSAANLSAEGDAALPDMVGYVPLSRPDAGSVLAETAAVAAPAEPAEQAAAAEAKGVEPAAAQSTASAPQEAPATSAPAETTAAKKPEFFLSQGDPSVFEQQPIEPKKKSFLSSFFGASSAQAAPVVVKPAVAAKPKPIVELAAAKTDGEDGEPLKQPAVRASYDPGDNGLPGVRQSALFEIKRKSGLDDDSDVDLHEDEMEPVQVASAAGLARLAPNGLLKQRESVDVACLKPSLVRVLKTIERHYGRKIVVTSGYRSPSYNRQVRGAKRSMHMFCAAADIQIAGVGKWELAKYVRSMPGRGGVGTYCHTESVHVDIGPERDWNWRCRRRKA